MRGEFMVMMRERRRLIFGLTAAILAISLSSTEAAEDRFTTGSADPLIQYIDEQVRTGWADNEIEPSAPADDADSHDRSHPTPPSRVNQFGRDAACQFAAHRTPRALSDKALTILHAAKGIRPDGVMARARHGAGVLFQLRY